MIADSLPNIQRTAFSASTSHDGVSLHVHLNGNADTEIMADLTQFLAAVHELAQSSKVKTVVVDSRSLYFMTSSCFKCFLTWISAVEALDPRAQYSIRLEANSKLHWQRRSFDALRAFSEHIVTVDI